MCKNKQRKITRNHSAQILIFLNNVRSLFLIKFIFLEQLLGHFKKPVYISGTSDLQEQKGEKQSCYIQHWEDYSWSIVYNFGFPN